MFQKALTTIISIGMVRFFKLNFLINIGSIKYLTSSNDSMPTADTANVATFIFKTFVNNEIQVYSTGQIGKKMF